MARVTAQARPLRVALTGATGDLGQLLLPLLEADERVGFILALDVVRPERTADKVEYRRLDLAGHGADGRLAQLLLEHEIDAVYHLAFLWSPIQNTAFAHELEVIGSLHVLTAVAAANIKRLVLPSLTAVYGARRENPAWLVEEMAAKGTPGSRFVSDKLEVEQQVRTFRPNHPDIQVLVLRFAPIVGPTVNNPVTRFLRAPLVPTLLGFDPLWQAVHEDDAARALHLALHSEAQGELNVVGQGVLPLSGMIKLAGGTVLPLPHPVARGAIRVLNATGSLGVPMTLLDYMQYSWLADGRKAEKAIGYVPRFHAREAVGALERSA